MPLQPVGQRAGSVAVLEEEPQAPGYVVHKIAVWRPTVSMTISGVCRYSPGGNWVGQFPYGQGAAAAAAAVAEEEEEFEVVSHNTDIEPYERTFSSDEDITVNSSK